MTRASEGAVSAAVSGRQLWIFSPLADLLAFTLPAVLALGAIAVSRARGVEDPGPEWLWIAAVLCVDVAHVWSTAFITYLDRAELRRRPQRYWLTPALGWVVGVVLYSLCGALAFWRTLAYVAVFHFVRQQYGWMALYRARAGDRSRVGLWIDASAIYAATLYPLIWWHAHLPRNFAWFLPGDFMRGLPEGFSSAVTAAYALALGAYVVRAVRELARGAPIPWGKHALLVTTAATWYAGIVATDSDLAFMLTNVLVHGIPYAVLVFSYARHNPGSEGLAWRVMSGPTLGAACRFVACLWLLAYGEELLWDRSVWHERPELFGPPFELPAIEALLIPLLAVPQLSHYVLDGLFWRRADNPKLREWLIATGGR